MNARAVYSLHSNNKCHSQIKVSMFSSSCVYLKVAGCVMVATAIYYLSVCGYVILEHSSHILPLTRLKCELLASSIKLHQLHQELRGHCVWCEMCCVGMCLPHLGISIIIVGTPITTGTPGNACNYSTTTCMYLVGRRRKTIVCSR